jgi:hypothetical protein
MTRAEIISNVVAATALLVSALGFYYQYFTNVHDLRVSLISLEINDNELEGTYVFSNYGTNQEVVAFYRHVIGPNSTSSSEKPLIKFHAPMAHFPKHDPFLIDPGKHQLVRMTDKLDDKSVKSVYPKDESMTLKVGFNVAIKTIEGYPEGRVIEIGEFKRTSNGFEFLSGNLIEAHIFNLLQKTKVF